jgi:secondary thiamine-phosphate synthase enzyme
MKVHSFSFEIETRGKGTYEITDRIADALKESGVKEGIVTIFVAHTSASLVIYENADPTAREDLHRFFEKLAPESGHYIHGSEGPDDSTSHLRMALTRTSETIPFHEGKLRLGRWQGLFIFEHRKAPHRRKIEISIVGI